tara:strand:+ start:15844 stop:16005 length:162 start_codon:yes stop_codon:yes gene_type:complete
MADPKTKKYSVKEGCEGQQVYCGEGVIVLTGNTAQKSLKYLYDTHSHPSVEYK